MKGLILLEENYYDILEVSKNASPEIIEKAYKTLVKKYHPDLQDNNLKIKYEEKIKKINEAYEVLSNYEKRKNYDLNLKNNEISIEDYNNLYSENINLKSEINYLKNNYDETKINCKTNNSPNKTNFNIYSQNYKKNNEYKITYKKLSKDFIALIITIIIIIFTFFILWQIPFTKKYLINLYNENFIFKFIVDLFFDIFK